MDHVTIRELLRDIEIVHSKTHNGFWIPSKDGDLLNGSHPGEGGYFLTTSRPNNWSNGCLMLAKPFRTSDNQSRGFR